jgi:hypothetical protein
LVPKIVANDPLAVVNCHESVPVIAFPARSMTFETWTVWTAPVVRALAGVKVAVEVPASYVVVPDTAVPDGLRSTSDSDCERIGSLKPTVTAVVGGTEIAPGAGVRETTLGPSWSAKTRSTQ